MNQTDNQNEAFNLEWDLDHIGDDEFDAQLVKFPGYENIVQLASTKQYSLPERIFFEANFRTLETIDFPYNDVHWPIMSKRMLDVLLSVNDFPHRTIQIIMVDDTITQSNRYGEGDVSKSGIENYRFLAIQLLKHLDLLDWENSIYSRDEDFPKLAFDIKRLVLKKPTGGFPPLFRLSADPISLFVSSDAKIALERANIQGLDFVNLENFRS